jgi:hypothetical protein
MNKRTKLGNGAAPLYHGLSFSSGVGCGYSYSSGKGFGHGYLNYGAGSNLFSLGFEDGSGEGNIESFDWHNLEDK